MITCETFLKKLPKRVEELEIQGKIETIQMTALSQILRRVLMTYC